MALKKQTASLLVLALVTIVGVVIYKQLQPKQKIYTQVEAEQIITNAYVDINGFSILTHERKAIEECGGNPTYGEITFEAVDKLAQDLNLTAYDVFFDLGAGVGKACMQIALSTPATAIGVELSETRFKCSMKARAELIRRKILLDTSKLQFRHENIVDTNISTGTVFFLCSTCFSDELMQKLTDNIGQLPQATRIITLKQLPENNYYTLLKTYYLPMSWSESSPVYLYQKNS